MSLCLTQNRSHKLNPRFYFSNMTQYLFSEVVTAFSVAPTPIFHENFSPLLRLRLSSMQSERIVMTYLCQEAGPGIEYHLETQRRCRRRYLHQQEH